MPDKLIFIPSSPDTAVKCILINDLLRVIAMTKQIGLSRIFNGDKMMFGKSYFTYGDLYF